MYSGGKTIQKIYDVFLIWKNFRRSHIIIFVNHDCFATALAVKFSGSVEFRDKYPHIDVSGKRLTMSLSNRIASFIFNLKLDMINDHGLPILSFQKLILGKAKIGKPSSDYKYKLSNKTQKRLIFICDATFCRDFIYQKYIKKSLCLLKNKFPDFSLFIKEHPKNSSEKNVDFGIGEKLPTDFPVEILIGRNDILVGLYSSFFESFQHLRIISVLNFIEPKQVDHEALKNICCTEGIGYRMRKYDDKILTVVIPILEVNEDLINTLNQLANPFVICLLVKPVVLSLNYPFDGMSIEVVKRAHEVFIAL